MTTLVAGDVAQDLDGHAVVGAHGLTSARSGETLHAAACCAAVPSS